MLCLARRRLDPRKLPERADRRCPLLNIQLSVISGQESGFDLIANSDPVREAFSALPICYTGLKSPDLITLPVDANCRPFLQCCNAQSGSLTGPRGYVSWRGARCYWRPVCLS
jgi:hypothetical protein